MTHLLEKAFQEAQKLSNYLQDELAQQLLEDIENEFDVKTQREPDFGFCYPAYRWANGHSLSSVLKGTDMTVGDFVRSIRQLIDLLTQIAGASEELRPICKEGIKRLDRGVISDMLGDI